MRTRMVLAAAALAGGLLLVPAAMEQAKAAHGGGGFGGGGHFGGGMGGGHFSWRSPLRRWTRRRWPFWWSYGRPALCRRSPGTAVLGGMAGRAAWHGNWHGNNWHGHDHDHFVHDHDHFRNRFVAVEWWMVARLLWLWHMATAGVRGSITKRSIPAAPIGGIGITPAPITTDGSA